MATVASSSASFVSSSSASSPVLSSACWPSSSPSSSPPPVSVGVPVPVPVGCLSVDESSALSIILDANGVSEEEFNGGAAKDVTKLEIFLVPYSKMIALQFFINLTHLEILSQNIECIEGLERCVHLEHVCLTENRISRIEGLETLTSLTSLNLSNNAITRIEGLTANTELRILFLSTNKIKKLEGLSTLKKLKRLWVAANVIEEVETALDHLPVLDEVNLSANRINSFKEIRNLSRLKRLRSLYLSDPHFGDNPVCNLCNYRTYAVYHLGHLEVLDSIRVSDDAVQFAEATYLKKKMYYNMRIKTAKRNTSNVIRKANEARLLRIQQINLKLNVLQRHMKDIENVLEERQFVASRLYDSGGGASKEAIPDKLLKDKRAALMRAMQFKLAEINKIEDAFENVKKEVAAICDQVIQRLIMELETGGNMRLEDGRLSDVWFTSCVDLLNSRFVPRDFADNGISEMRINRITRIHNRFLRNRFEEKLEMLVDTSNPSYKQQVEYLFYGIDPHHPQELIRATEVGFPSSKENLARGTDGAVVLSNSVSLCDLPRLNHFAQQPGFKNLSVVPGGKLLVVKVYLGNSSVKGSTSSSSTSGNVANPNAPFTLNIGLGSQCLAPSLLGGPPGMTLKHLQDVIRADLKLSGSALYDNEEATGTAEGGEKGAPVPSWLIAKKHYPHVDSVYEIPDGDTKLRRWYVFDHCMVLPEYLVEFEYLRSPYSFALSSSSSSPSAATLSSSSSSLVSLAHRRSGSRPAAVSLSPSFFPVPLSSPVGTPTAASAVAAVVASPVAAAVVTDSTRMSLSRGGQQLPLSSPSASSSSSGSSFVAAMNLSVASSTSSSSTTSNSTTSVSDTTPNFSVELTSIDELGNIGTMRVPLMQFISDCSKAQANDATDISTTALDMGPSLPNEAKLVTLSRDTVLSSGGGSSCESISYLNLHGSGIKKIENLLQLVNLKVLVLSFNEINKIEGLQDLRRLERLELGFNLISRIEGLTGLTSLTTLELNNNLLYRLEDVQLLVKSTPRLANLNLRENTICDSKGYRLAVLSRLTDLNELDGMLVTKEDRVAAQSSSTTLTDELIHGHSTCERNRSLSLAPRHHHRAARTGRPGSAALGLGGTTAENDENTNVSNINANTSESGLSLEAGSVKKEVAGVGSNRTVGSASGRGGRGARAGEAASRGIINPKVKGNNNNSTNRNFKPQPRRNKPSATDTDSGDSADDADAVSDGRGGGGGGGDSGDDANDTTDGAGQEDTDTDTDNDNKGKRNKNGNSNIDRRTTNTTITKSNQQSSGAAAAAAGRGVLKPQTSKLSAVGTSANNVATTSDVDSAAMGDNNDDGDASDDDQADEKVDEKEVGPDDWWSKALELDLDHQRLRRIQNLDRLKNLRKATFNDNELCRIEGLEQMLKLEDLALEENRITKLENLAHLTKLKKLDLGKNKISRIEELEKLNQLTQLSLEDNEIKSVNGLQELHNLMELYIGNNSISSIKEVLHLRNLPKLIILDLSGNPLCREPDYRSYVIFHLHRLKVLDGLSVDAKEVLAAKEKYTGRVTYEFLVDKIGHKYFEHIRELDLSNCRIRSSEGLDGLRFCNLRELNLDNNLISDVAGIGRLTSLTVLRLNHNRIAECEYFEPESGRSLSSLLKLEVLQLGNNRITSIAALNLRNMPELKALFLQGNEIPRVDGLEFLPQLRELVLNKNKIRKVEPRSFLGLGQLRELRLEDNGLRSLANFEPLQKLQLLYIGGNRVSDLSETGYLSAIPYLLELICSGNPIARKQLYRPSLIQKIPSLRFIDSKEVTEDERDRAELLFSPQAEYERSASIYYAADAHGGGTNIVTMQQLGGMGIVGGLGGINPNIRLAPQQPAQMMLVGGSSMVTAFGGGFSAGPGIGGISDRVPVKVTAVNFDTLTSFGFGHYSSNQFQVAQSQTGAGGGSNYNNQYPNYGSGVPVDRGAGGAGGPNNSSNNPANGSSYANNMESATAIYSQPYPYYMVGGVSGGGERGPGGGNQRSGGGGIGGARGPARPDWQAFMLAKNNAAGLSTAGSSGGSGSANLNPNPGSSPTNNGGNNNIGVASTSAMMAGSVYGGGSGGRLDPPPQPRRPIPFNPANGVAAAAGGNTIGAPTTTTSDNRYFTRPIAGSLTFSQARSLDDSSTGSAPVGTYPNGSNVSPSGGIGGRQLGGGIVYNSSSYTSSSNSGGAGSLALGVGGSAFGLSGLSVGPSSSGGASSGSYYGAGAGAGTGGVMMGVGTGAVDFSGRNPFGPGPRKQPPTRKTRK